MTEEELALLRAAEEAWRRGQGVEVMWHQQGIAERLEALGLIATLPALVRGRQTTKALITENGRWHLERIPPVE